MNNQSLVRQYNLKVADAVELVSPGNTFPKHYAFYMGHHAGQISFLANTQTGVRVICGEELESFIAQYEIIKIERPCKNDRQRNYIIQRALTRLGEKEYNLIFNNCEHFKNWVLYGHSHSPQVVKAAKTLFIAGAAMAAVGYATKKKGLQKAGLLVMLSPLIIIVLAMLIASLNKS